jgi:hypothetical protein
LSTVNERLTLRDTSERRSDMGKKKKDKKGKKKKK